MHSHIVVIGGTGMLFGVSRQLAADCRTLTSVARTDHSLRALDTAITPSGCTHRMLTADWIHADDFISSVANSVRESGPADLVLAWLHDDSLGPRLATALAPATTRCAFFQIRGSAARDPTQRTETVLRDWQCPPTMDYYQVILGFHADAAGSRWMRDDEICAGVLDAIAHPRTATIVGTITPWAARPS